MSVTTTQNPVTQSVLQVLADYDLHHSGSLEQPSVPEKPSEGTSASSNPDWWPTNHNRVPQYRPVDRNLDLDQRPNGINAAERLFIFTMLNGCRVNANAAQLWRKTGGRINDRIFYYKIGGEK